ATGEPPPPHLEPRRLPRGGERVERRDRGRVVDHSLEGLGEPDQLPQPREGDLLQLGRRRRSPPEHRLLVERRAEHLAHHPGTARRYREVAEEARVVPVRRRRDDQALEVVEYLPEILASEGSFRWERPDEVTRRDLREDGEALRARE